MDNRILIWLLIFAVSAAGFFSIAAIVAVKGFGDLKTLLRHSDRRESSEMNNDPGTTDRA